LRSTIMEVAGRHGLAPIACSTHPFSRWSDHAVLLSAVCTCTSVSTTTRCASTS
jgi:gamma-glutamyl:cysteine ligase YbdK (ATP-grasp superfamily)